MASKINPDLYRNRHTSLAAHRAAVKAQKEQKKLTGGTKAKTGTAATTALKKFAGGGGPTKAVKSKSTTTNSSATAKTPSKPKAPTKPKAMTPNTDHPIMSSSSSYTGTRRDKAPSRNSNIMSSSSTYGGTTMPSNPKLKSKPTRKSFPAGRSGQAAYKAALRKYNSKKTAPKSKAPVNRRGRRA